MILNASANGCSSQVTPKLTVRDQFDQQTMALLLLGVSSGLLGSHDAFDDINTQAQLHKAIPKRCLFCSKHS